ncbi:hypothetical protein TIFTF001_022412 [Ficus carica]|uniref:Uncharacterized protein n=1 Tax=Ficus carica TaxID=3494 RepID=A0AA88AJ65_FICCA|nr:hypothetical protein TIFTF001_022412 [Ficus carica]
MTPGTESGLEIGGQVWDRGRGWVLRLGSRSGLGSGSRLGFEMGSRSRSGLGTGVGVRYRAGFRLWNPLVCLCLSKVICI